MHAFALASMLLLGGDADAGAQARWELVWRDEFDGDAIDLKKWELEENCWGGGNHEQQCYTRRRGKFANAFVADGLLYLVAKREAFTASNQPDGRGRSTATLPYTSARLRTRHRQEWTFGRFEVRARLPQGRARGRRSGCCPPIRPTAAGPARARSTSWKR